jgi:hypothetical protein
MFVVVMTMTRMAISDDVDDNGDTVDIKIVLLLPVVQMFRQLTFHADAAQDINDGATAAASYKRDVGDNW